MPDQPLPVAVGEPLHPHRLGQPQHRPRVIVEARRHEHPPVVVHRDEPTVERGVQVGGQKQAVEDVEPLRVGVAPRSGLDVARAEYAGPRSVQGQIKDNIRHRHESLTLERG